MPEGAPLEVADVLALWPPLEVVSGPPLEMSVGLKAVEAVKVELEMDLEGG